jgi:predicted negative regulator of RcsB-dependent stress response
MFMLLTGPVMVLAVLLAGWLGWRAWQRRRAGRPTAG